MNVVEAYRASDLLDRKVGRDKKLLCRRHFYLIYIFFDRYAVGFAEHFRNVVRTVIELAAEVGNIDGRIDVIVDVVEHFLHRDAGVGHTVGCRAQLIGKREEKRVKLGIVAHLRAVACPELLH